MAAMQSFEENAADRGLSSCGCGNLLFVLASISDRLRFPGRMLHASSARLHRQRLIPVFLTHALGRLPPYRDNSAADWLQFKE